MTLEKHVETVVREVLGESWVFQTGLQSLLDAANARTATSQTVILALGPGVRLLPSEASHSAWRDTYELFIMGRESGSSGISHRVTNRALRILREALDGTTWTEYTHELITGETPTNPDADGTIWTLRCTQTAPTLLVAGVDAYSLSFQLQ